MAEDQFYTYIQIVVVCVTLLRFSDTIETGCSMAIKAIKRYLARRAWLKWANQREQRHSEDEIWTPSVKKSFPSMHQKRSKS